MRDDTGLYEEKPIMSGSHTYHMKDFSKQNSFKCNTSKIEVRTEKIFL